MSFKVRASGLREADDSGMRAWDEVKSPNDQNSGIPFWEPTDYRASWEENEKDRLSNSGEGVLGRSGPFVSSFSFLDSCILCSCLAPCVRGFWILSRLIPLER